MAVKREKIHLESVEELLGAPRIQEGIEEIEIGLICSFENHPFKVLDDEKMLDLVESIKANGVLVPVLVRPNERGKFEMISGHRRLHASKLAGLNKIPAIINNMTDDEATIAMVDANVQREEILPSERAFSLKMKMDAMRRQGSRINVTSAHNGRRLETADIVGREVGMGKTQVKRYIRLTQLIPELLDFLDQKKIGLLLAYNISFFEMKIQKWIYEYIKENHIIENSQIEALKSCSNINNITQYSFIQIMNAAIEKKVSRQIFLSENMINKYFGPEKSKKEIRKIITTLLDQWVEEAK